MAEIRRLTDEERALAGRWWPLAYRMALRYAERTGADFSDAISDAALGLVEAALAGEKVNPSTGRPYAFGTLLTLHVRRALSRERCWLKVRPASIRNRTVPMPASPPALPDPLQRWVDLDAARHLLAGLGRDHRRAVSMRLVDNRTLDEIARRLHCTPKHAGRLVADGVRAARAAWAAARKE